MANIGSQLDEGGRTKQLNKKESNLNHNGATPSLLNIKLNYMMKELCIDGLDWAVRGGWGAVKSVGKLVET